jgi:hypothetical protein
MKKRIADLTPEEQQKVRAYNREQKQKSREKQKADASVPAASEASDTFAIDFTERRNTLTSYVKEFQAKVVEELGRGLGAPQRGSSGNVTGWDNDEEFTIDRVARCLLGLKNNWVQKVSDPVGELVAGMYFADAASSMIESANRHGLKQSHTFSQLYVELLKMLDRRYGHEQTDDAQIIKAELAGEYVLPPLPELPKPEPKKIQEAPSVPSHAEMLEEGRLRLLNQLQPQFRVQDPNVPPDARRFLDGTL